MTETVPPHVHVAIAGSGFAGLGMAIKLKEAGFDDFLIFERANDIGGVWRDNEYPGCACDVESHLYSFSFAPNPSWSRMFSGQREILEYLRGCADRFGVRPNVRLGHEIKKAAFVDGRWRIETSQGPYTADLLISGTGALCDPTIPELPGLQNFRGKTFHSARWDHQHALEGKNIAVIGTGASAIQFVPEIQPRVKKLSIFQRTAPWIVPRNDRPISEKARRLFRSFPLAQFFIRLLILFVRELFALPLFYPRLMKYAETQAIRHMKRTVKDRELRKKLTPNYRMGCKRILLSDDYYPAITQPNVDVVTAKIREIRESSIVTEDGVEHAVDTIIFGTGFRVTDPPIAEHIRGRDGKTLAEVWRGSPRAYFGSTVPGFPNFFLLLGPNVGLGHSSVVLMIEAQIAHVIGALRFLKKKNLASIEVRPEVEAAYVKQVDAKMKNTVFLDGGCVSWYRDSTGRISTLWPGFTWSFRWRARRFNPAKYVVAPATAQRSRDRETTSSSEHFLNVSNAPER